jgi:hypothetical protein
VSVPGWNGAGYIILDPDTGDGAYKIESGANGAYVSGLILGGFVGTYLTLLAGGVFSGVGTAAAPFLGALLIAVSIFASIYFTIMRVFIWNKKANECFIQGFDFAFNIGTLGFGFSKKEIIDKVITMLSDALNFTVDLQVEKGNENECSL